jgi:hypothetical protein
MRVNIMAESKNKAKNKEKVLAVRLSERELERLDVLARARNSTRSAVAREIITGRAFRPASDKVGVQIERLRQLRLLSTMLTRRDTLSEEEQQKLQQIFDNVYENFFAPVRAKAARTARASRSGHQ